MSLFYKTISLVASKFANKKCNLGLHQLDKSSLLNLRSRKEESSEGQLKAEK